MWTLTAWSITTAIVAVLLLDYDYRSRRRHRRRSRMLATQPQRRYAFMVDDCPVEVIASDDLDAWSIATDKYPDSVLQPLWDTSGRVPPPPAVNS